MGPIRGLQHLRLFVRPLRWDATVRFYGETLGLPLRERDGASAWAVFSLPRGASLGLERVDPDDQTGASLAGRFTGVALEVENVNRALKILRKAGVEVLSPPLKEAWGGTVAHVRDPAGNVLTLSEAAGRGKARRPARGRGKGRSKAARRRAP